MVGSAWRIEVMICCTAMTRPRGRGVGHALGQPVPDRLHRLGQAEPAGDVLLGRPPGLAVDHAVGRQVLDELPGHPAQVVGGLHHGDGVVEGLQEPLQRARAGGLPEPGAQVRRRCPPAAGGRSRWRARARSAGAGRRPGGRAATPWGRRAGSSRSTVIVCVPNVLEMVGAEGLRQHRRHREDPLRRVHQQLRPAMLPQQLPAAAARHQRRRRARRRRRRPPAGRRRWRPGTRPARTPHTASRRTRRSPRCSR